MRAMFGADACLLWSVHVISLSVLLYADDGITVCYVIQNAPAQLHFIIPCF